jgi:hypothetical protein
LLAATATGAAGAATVDAELALAAGADAFLPELLDCALLAADAAGLASSFLANLTSGFAEDAAAGAVASTLSAGVFLVSSFLAAGAVCAKADAIPKDAINASTSFIFIPLKFNE